MEKTFDTLLVVNTVTVTVALIITLLFSDYLNPRLIKLSWIVSGLFGNVFYGSAEPDSIRYVAQYVDKKYSGDLAKQEYEDKKRAPVFRVSSLGLGKKYIDKNRKQITEMGYCTVKGVMHSLPRYYLNRLGIDPALYRQTAQLLACEQYEEATGLHLDPDIAYHVRPASEYTKYAKEQEAKRKQSDQNKSAKVALKKRKL